MNNVPESELLPATVPCESCGWPRAYAWRPCRRCGRVPTGAEDKQHYVAIEVLDGPERGSEYLLDPADIPQRIGTAAYRVLWRVGEWPR